MSVHLVCTRCHADTAVTVGEQHCYECMEDFIARWPPGWTVRDDGQWCGAPCAPTDTREQHGPRLPSPPRVLSPWPFGDVAAKVFPHIPITKTGGVTFRFTRDTPAR